MFHIKNYEKADSVDHAVELLKANPKSRLLAGGTDVLVRLAYSPDSLDFYNTLNEQYNASCDVGERARLRLVKEVIPPFINAMQREIQRSGPALTSAAMMPVIVDMIGMVWHLAGDTTDEETEVFMKAIISDIRQTLKRGK